MVAEKRIFDLKSAWSGIKCMKLKNNAKWVVKFMPKRFWFHFWTPVWHNGDGPYLTCGIWVIAIYRGY